MNPPPPNKNSQHTLRRREMTVGFCMLSAAALGLLLSNLPVTASYGTFLETHLGPSWLSLSLSQWCADGLLTLFFLTVGLELSTELSIGSLRRPRAALLPVIAALGGMFAPAGIFLVVSAAGGTLASNAHGWAIPTATDIAFALGAAAVLVPGMTRPVRLFLLTLATVDDLLGILIIAIFYSKTVQLLPLLVALGIVAIYAVLVRRLPPSVAWLLLIVGVLSCWGALHAAGVHPTLSGVAIGLCTPARNTGRLTAEDVRRHVNPLSDFVVLPLFAITAAAVPLTGSTLTNRYLPLLIATATALCIGKPLGVLAATWLAARFTPLQLPDGVDRVRTLLPAALLTGIGFTIALLFAGLAFSSPSEVHAAKLGILLGTVASGTAAALVGRGRWHRRQTSLPHS